MLNRLPKIVWLVAVTALVVGGCQDNESKKASVSVGRKVDAVADPDRFAIEAIDATGGQKAWNNSQNFVLDTVLTFYRSDASTYLTEHKFDVHPHSDSVVVSAQEPLGRFVWLLTGRQFCVIEGQNTPDVSGRRVSVRELADAVLLITTAPVRLLDASAVHSRDDEAIKMEGNWYYPISRSPLTAEAPKPYWSSIVLYQNRANDVIDTIHLTTNGRMLAVRGYDYMKTRRGGVAVPTKIEIFETDANGVLKQRLVTIDAG